MRHIEGKKGLLSAALFFLLVLGVFFVLVRQFFLASETEFGVTYSHTHARYLGLDEREAYTALLDDLQAKKIRVPLYWNQIEPQKGEYNWSMTDFMLDEAAKRDAKVTLVIGNKVPRWPECHTPYWVMALSVSDGFERSLKDYMTNVVNRYKDHPALLRWQVENEPLFPFGECPLPDPELLREEIELVRNLDPHHPIQLTVSGEQEAWISLAGSADVIGTSLYRIVWNEVVGFVNYPHSPAWYGFQRMTISPWVDQVVISELQAEPWLEGGAPPKDIATAYSLFSVKELEAHVYFARRAGFSETYLWGAEWWYYLHKNGESRLWEEGRQIFE